MNVYFKLFYPRRVLKLITPNNTETYCDTKTKQNRNGES